MYVNTLSPPSVTSQYGTAIYTDSSEMPCVCWELNLGPLGKQPVLLTTKTSLQLQIPKVFIYLSQDASSHIEVGKEAVLEATGGPR